MKRSFALISLAAALALPAGAAAAKPPRCEARGGTTLVTAQGRRVFTTFKQSKSDPDANTIKLFGCWAHSRKPPHLLDTFKNNLDGSATPGIATIAGGRWALVQLTDETGVTSGMGLGLYNLRKGKSVAGGYIDGADSSLSSAVTATGAFAFLDNTRGVIAFDNTGEHDLGPATATDLTAVNERIYWMEGDVAHTAKLGTHPKKSFDLE